MLSALRHREFRLFWIGLFVAESGQWMQLLGQGWLVVLLAFQDGSAELAPFYLGLLGLFRAVPSLMFGLVGGALADRIDGRRVLIATAAGMSLLSVGLAVLVETNAVRIWSLLLISAANSSVMAFHAPTRQSMAPRLVASAHLTSAIGLNAAASNLPQIIAPAIGGLLIAASGVAGVFAIHAAAFGVVVVIAVSMLPIPPDPRARRDSVGRNILDALIHVGSNSLLRDTIVLATVVAVFARPYVFLLPALAQNVLNAGSAGLAVLIVSTGVGSLCGSLLMTAIGRVHRRGALLLLCAGTLGLGVTVFSLQQTLATAVVAAVAVGFATMLFMGLSTTVVQIVAPREFIGRVMSMYVVVFLAGVPLGQMILGTLGSWIGIDWALLCGGLITIVAAGYMATRVDALRRLRSPTDALPYVTPT